MKKKPHNSTLIFTLIVSAAALGYAFGVFRPVQQAIADLRAETNLHAQYIKTADRQFLAYAGVEQSLRETEAYVNAWRENAPDAQQFAACLGEITRLAAESHASLQRFTPQAVNPWETLLEHPIEAVVEGRFAEIHAFMRGLEGLSPTIWVENLDIQVIDRNGGELRCELTLKVFNENPGSSD